MRPAQMSFLLAATASLGCLAGAPMAGPIGSATGRGSAAPQPERKEVADIHRLGGTVGTVNKDPNSPITNIDLHGSHVDDAHLRTLVNSGTVALLTVRDLNLNATRVTDAGLEH